MRVIVTPLVVKSVGVVVERVRRVAVSTALAIPGRPPTAEEIQAAVDAYLTANPTPPGDVSAEALAEAVADYLALNPIEVPPAVGPTPEQITAAVAVYLASNPPPPGQDATDAQVQAALVQYFAANPVENGEDATPEQIATAVAQYLMANPPQPGADASPQQIAAAVAAYLTANPPDPGEPGSDATPEQIALAVADYLAANPPAPGDPGENATPEQVSGAVASYLQANPPPAGADATDMQVAAAVAAYLDANPPPAGQDATDMQVAAAVAQYFAANPPPSGDDYALAPPDGDSFILQSSRGQPNGVGSLDASGALAQRIKSAANDTPGISRDAGGLFNGKASVFPASIATDGSSHVIIRTGVWRGELSYHFRVAGPAGDGVLSLLIYRAVIDGAAFYGYVNNGTIPVTVTFGMFNDGYSSWAIQGALGRAQLVVTEAAVVGNGTDDAAVRDWMMYAANDTGQLGQQVTVPLRSIAA